VQRSSAETERLDRELRDARHIHIQLQSALEAERIHHLRARRENRAIQTVLEEAYVELQALKAENSRLRESNRALLFERKEIFGLDRNIPPPLPSPALPTPPPCAPTPAVAAVPTAPILHPFEPDGDDLSTLLTPTTLRRTAAAAGAPPTPPDGTDERRRSSTPPAPPADAASRSDSGGPAEPSWPSPRPAPAPPAPAADAPLAPADPRGGAGDACGVGVRVTEAAPYRIAGCAVGGPAHRSGELRPGDHLLAVDAQSTRGMTPTAVRRRLAGPPGSVVRLQLARAAPAGGGEERRTVFEVALERAPSRAWRPPSADAGPGPPG
jgi:hypothetical protein